MLEAHYATADDIDAAMKIGLRAADGAVRAAGRGRPRRGAGHRARRSTRSSARPGSRRRRCWSTWSRPGGWAARPATASATTTGASACRWPASPTGAATTTCRCARPARRAASRSRRTASGRCGRSAARRRPKTYRCPGCDQVILPGTPHVVAWPAADHGSVERPAALAHAVLGGARPAADPGGGGNREAISPRRTAPGARVE